MISAALVAVGLGAPAQAATTFDVFLDAGQEVAPAGQQDVDATGFGTARIQRDATGALELGYSLAFDNSFDFGPILGDPEFPFALPAGTIGDIGARTGLEVTRLHIHNGARGQNGPVAYGIVNPGTEQDFDAVVSQFGALTLVSGGWDAAEGTAGLTFDTFAGDLLALGTGEDAPPYFNLHTANDPAGAIRGQLVAKNDLGLDAVAPIPIPASLPLLLAGLGGLGLSRRITRRRAGD